MIDNQYHSLSTPTEVISCINKNNDSYLSMLCSQFDIEVLLSLVRIVDEVMVLVIRSHEVTFFLVAALELISCLL